MYDAAAMPVVPIDELCALARAVALDGDLDVQVGAPGSGWFIRTETGVINIDGDDVERAHPDDVRGLICHEAAHAAVTRYLHIVPKDRLRQPGMASLLNSLEDCRIEEWLAVRFPGTEAWIGIYNDRLFPEDARGLSRAPWFQQFCLGAIHEWWHGVTAPGLHPEVVRALEVTRDARQRVVALQPPVDADVSPDLAAPYAKSRVARVFAARDRFAPPDTFERVVRLTAYEAWRIVYQDIVPVFVDLIARDKENAAHMKEAERRFLQQLGELRFPGPARARRRVGRLPAWAGPEARAGVAEPSEVARRAVDEVVHAPPSDVYAEARSDVGGLVERLFDELERVLRPESYPQWVPGHPSGSRLDLRVAMAVDVEPGAYLRMWQRKTLPRKRDPAFLLLLDLSGSMSGERIHHAFRGVVLVAEVLERLGVPFAVAGFQDSVIPFKDFAQPLDATTRRQLGAMPMEVHGHRPGGHNRPQHNWDGPVLHAATDRLVAWPAGTRILLVLSDGEPSGPADAEGALRRAVERIEARGDLHLVGVGLGAGTDHVARFYPTHLANVALDALPAALGACIDRLLRRR